MCNYVAYHVHTELSLLDSCSNYKLYVDRAVELGQKAIGFSEHGNIASWVAKKLYCKEKGIKYLHGVEIYLTRDLKTKVRDNFHTILISKNYEGFLELNSLIEISSREDHSYYNDRISFDEFFNLSDNIIKISACLNSPLNKIDDNDPIYERLVKSYDYLEVQPHINSEDQKKYNKKLLRLSEKYNIPLIAATDTHSIDSYKAECRAVLLKAKGRTYGNEDEFDLTYKSYDELVEMFRLQGALPKEKYLEAIHNTNIMADSVEEWDVDTSFKYPVLYDNEKEVFRERIMQMYKEKLDKGIIEDNPKYLENIEEEVCVFEKIGMTGFMLFMSELMCWCWENNIPSSPCRGSVGGSTVAYITDITDVDPVLRNTVFSRFANEHRIEIGDIDVDYKPTDRARVYNYIINRFGEEYTAYVMTNGTCVDKRTIDEIGRGLNIPYNEVSEIKDAYAENPNNARDTYPEVFKYFDGLINTTISKGIHPAAIIISPIPLSENYGVYHHKDTEGNQIRVINLNMDELHEISLVKYDILGLKNVGVIKDCCELAGIPYPKSRELDWDDEDVWDDINKSNIGIFQFESSYAGDCLRRFGVRSIDDMSLVNAALRPSGASYRDSLFAKKINNNPSEIIDQMLENSYGRLVFQTNHQISQDICGLSGSDADNVRRAIGRKQKDRLEEALPQILDGYCSKSDKPRKEAEKEAHEFLQIIEHSADYQFGFNHSTGYSMLGYMCGYLRYHYPIEFCTALLLNANNEDDIADGTELSKLKGIKINPVKFRYSKADYFMDKETNTIYKGVGSIKYLSNKVADELFELRNNDYKGFIELLFDLEDKTSIDSKQLDILIKLNYFQEFNQNAKKLLQIVDIFTLFKKGKAKQIKKDKLDNHAIYEIVAKYSRGTNQSGEPLKNFIIEDIQSLLQECENYISGLEIYNFSLKERMQHEQEYLGYISPSQNEDERRLLLINDVKPLHRKRDNKRFGASIFTTSIGSGKRSRFTLFDRDVYQEIKKGDIIKCLHHKTDGQYFTLLEYEVVS